MPEEIVELSFRIDKASYDKASGEMRWSSVTSDTAPDSYDERMSGDLYQDFINRIKGNESPPAQYCSEAWRGGLPYVSVAHYPDLNGKGIAGDSKAIYVDGNMLKAKGTFRDTDLGRACFRAICDDLYSEKGQQVKDKIRISIAFLDWSHAHGAFIFERKSLSDRCPMCAQGQGDKVYLKGQLIHLALTRVPVNRRTDIMPDLEVEKSMATQVQDAASIVGKELAEELETAESIVGKSETLVVKSEEGVPVETEVEASPAEAVEPEEKVDPVEAPFVPVEVLQSVASRVTQLALDVQELSKMMKEKPARDDEEDEDEEKKKGYKKEKADHILDSAFDALRTAYDQVAVLELSETDKLQALQPAFNALGETLRSAFAPKVVVQEAAPVEKSQVEDLGSIFRAAIQPLVDKVTLLETQLTARNAAQTIVSSTPQRRSAAPALVVQKAQTVAEQGDQFDRIAARSVGLQGY